MQSIKLAELAPRSRGPLTLGETNHLLFARVSPFTNQSRIQVNLGRNPPQLFEAVVKRIDIEIGHDIPGNMRDRVQVHGVRGGKERSVKLSRRKQNL